MASFEELCTKLAHGLELTFLPDVLAGTILVTSLALVQLRVSGFFSEVKLFKRKRDSEGTFAFLIKTEKSQYQSRSTSYFFGKLH